MVHIKLTIFFDDGRLDALATSVQAETYRLLQSCFAESRKVTVGDLMQELGIKRRQSFFSRLQHLQEKNLIEWFITPHQPA